MARICQLHADLKYFLCMQPVDMRKQFHGLQGIVNEEFGRYLTHDEAFVFIGKTMKTAKILHRESNGLTMYVRRFSEGRFKMPAWNDDCKTCTLSYESVDRACIMYSLFGACKVLGKNPERWLTYVLKHIDTTAKEDLHKLLPEEWEDA